MPLEWLFGRRMTPDEMLRKNQRALTKVRKACCSLKTSLGQTTLYLSYQFIVHFLRQMKRMFVCLRFILEFI